MTLKELERRVAALMAGHPKPPTYEEFQELWKHMDGLSQSLYVLYAECPELLGPAGSDAYWQAVLQHIDRMGLVQTHQRLSDIVEDLESGREVF